MQDSMVEPEQILPTEQELRTHRAWRFLSLEEKGDSLNCANFSVYNQAHATTKPVRIASGTAAFLEMVLPAGARALLSIDLG